MTEIDVAALVRATTGEEDALVDELMKLSGAHVADVHTPFRTLRLSDPVHEGDVVEELGGRSVMSMREGPVFSLFRYDDVVTGYRETDPFSSAALREIFGAAYGNTIITMDPPEHRPARALAQDAFSRKRLDQWRRELFDPLIHGFIDAVIERGACDLLHDVLLPYPISVLHQVFGLPDDEVGWFHQQATRLLLVRAPDPTPAFEAAAALQDRLAELVRQRRLDLARGHVGDDVVTFLVQANDRAQILSDDDLVAFLRLLLPAGAETTQKAAANLVLCLLRHPDQLELVRDDPSLVPAAVEESLRFESSVTMNFRQTLRPVDIGGVRIPAGAGVELVQASAVRDAAHFDAPDEFDIQRTRTSPGIPFGHGIHLCLGHHMARMEMQSVLRALLERMPKLRLDPAHPTPEVQGITLRCVDHLRVRWD